MKITRARFTMSPFSPEDSTAIGNALLKSVKDRIHKGLNVDETPAKPLTHALFFPKDGSRTMPYTDYKTKRGRQAVRDLTNTGALMQSLQVTKASADGGTIGSNNVVKDAVLRVNNRRSREFGVSPSDKQALEAAAMQALKSKIKITET